MMSATRVDGKADPNTTVDVQNSSDLNMKIAFCNDLRNLDR